MIRMKEEYERGKIELQTSIEKKEGEKKSRRKISFNNNRDDRGPKHTPD